MVLFLILVIGQIRINLRSHYTGDFMTYREIHDNCGEKIIKCVGDIRIKISKIVPFTLQNKLDIPLQNLTLNI